jgi:long-chain acyl-CoA synthetase
VAQQAAPHGYVVTAVVNVGHALDGAVDLVPGRVALVVGDDRYSYAELERWVRRVAATLTARGAGPGDRVALVDNASVLSVATLLAAARIGAASAQMNVQLTPDELGKLSVGVGATIGVAGAAFRSRLAEALGPEAVLGEDDIAAPATSDDPDGAAPPAAGVADDDGALVLFTSGTTGLPKPIVISHGVVAERLRFYAAPIDPDGPQAVDMMSAPIFHIGGTLGLLVSLHAGRKVVALPRFDAGAWLRAVEEHRVSQTFMVPTMLQRILDHPDFASHDLGSLVQLSYGAAAAPVPLVERALDALPHVGFLNVFGQTETLGAYAALGADDHRARHKLGSAGKAFPGVELRIVDPAATGAGDPDAPAVDCAVGEVGEVWVRSAQNVTADWLRTGDLAALDDEGYLHPVGRMTDTINRGGEKFGPVEVEEALCSHPAVRDAGVVGVPDAELGQRVGAVVVLDGRAGGVVSPGADELRTHAARRLARYKLPDWIVFADDLPYSATGKVSRKALAATITAARDADDEPGEAN